MKTLLTVALFGLVVSVGVSAAPPAGAPAGTMGMCNDGTYSSSAEKKGACRGHKGVKEWYGEEVAPMAAPGGARTTTTQATTPSAAANTSTSTKPTSPAAGGGAGKVWANTSTKVYHCNGDKYYGTTKHGEYMSETDAKGKGYHADHGKACS